ncbi:MAG: 50S ribosomal protein L3 [bacterium]
MKQTLFAKKSGMTEAYLGDIRMAVTKLELYDTQVLREKNQDKDGYVAQLVSFGKAKKRPNKALVGMNKDGIVKAFVREVAPSETIVLSTGVLVNVQAISKGKGTAGVMKRWNFAGGPRTHGQSDRARAPGSIGQGTTPGRVLRGRHMAGRMGTDTITVRNLPVIALDEATKSLWIAGPVPGVKGGLVTITVTDTTVKLGELKYLKGYNSTPISPVEEVVTTSEAQG